jgi:beta-lactamase regulating signal transducer with metallopeptidase domain
MEAILHTFTSISPIVAGSLVAAIWQGMVLAVCIGLCLRLIPGITAAMRSMVWTAVLLLMVSLHLVPLMTRNATSSSAVQDHSMHLAVGWSLVLVCLWGVLSAVRGARLVRSAIYLQRLARKATPVLVDANIASVLRSAGRKVELCTSQDVDRPSVVGFLSPRILLPPDLLERLTPGELEQVLLHEVEHLRRADDWTNLLQKISLVLFPLNPVLLWVERQLCVERELACDDRVLKITKARKAYAACLTNLAEHSLLRRGISLALGAWERQSELSQRVHRILNRPEFVMRGWQAGVVGGVLVLGVAGGATTLARSPQLISFVTDASRPLNASAIGVEVVPPSVPKLSPVSLSGQRAHATMTKASMPMDDSGVKPVSGMPHRSATRMLTAKHAPYRLQNRNAQPSVYRLVMVSEWHEEIVQPARLTLAVQEETGSMYASVPTANGLLIIQL